MTISQKRLQGLRLKLQEYDSAENHTDNPAVCPIAVFLNSRTPGSIMSVAEKFSSDSLYKYIDNTLPSVKWIGNPCRMKEAFYGL